MIKLKTKIFLPALSLTILAVVIILAKYFFGYNQWKTYTYNQCGNLKSPAFSFKIPSGWKEFVVVA